MGMNGYDESIPWPKNLPPRLAKSAKRLDIYNKKEDLSVFFCLEQERMEMLAKTAEITDEITSEETDVILTKLGL